MRYFYNQYEIDVPENVYYPREDSELLAKTLEAMDLTNKKVLEMGCGSGFLSILMAKNGADVTSVDVNEDAVETTKLNAEKNAASLAVVNSDMFEHVRGIYDLIIFNPPYLPVEKGESDPTYAGGSTGREVIEVFIEQVGKYLKKTGQILLLVSSLTGEKEVLRLFRENGFEPSVIAKEKVPWEELMVFEGHFG